MEQATEQLNSLLLLFLFDHFSQCDLLVAMVMRRKRVIWISFLQSGFAFYYVKHLEL